MIDDDLPSDLRALLDAERRREEPTPQRKARVHQALAASLGGGFLPDGGGLDGGGLDGGASLGAGAGAAGAGAAGSAVGLGMKAGGAVATKVAAATVAKAGVTAAGVATASAVGAGSAVGGAAAGGAVAGTALGKGLALALALTMAGTTATGIYLAQSDEPEPAPDLRVDTEVPPDFDPSVLGARPAPAHKPRAPAARPAALPGGADEPAPPGVDLPLEPAIEPALEPNAEQRAERLAAERGLLDEARGAVSRGNGGAALLALEAHRQSFPDGQLVEEREALTVMALAKAGRAEEAQKKAERFRTRYPQSLFAAAVAQAIGQ